MMKHRHHVLALLALLALVALAPRLLRGEDPQAQLTDCHSNLKNLSTAMEMYSTDWSDRYPDRFEKLLPTYLTSLPACPVSGAMTYKMEYGPEAPHNECGFQDNYYLYCAGKYHSRSGAAENFPALDGSVSILER